MSGSVTVAGAHGRTVTLQYDANIVLARHLAAAITAGVTDGTILPATNLDGPPPALAPGTTGEFVVERSAIVSLPPGYKAVVDNARESIVFGSGDAGESVLAGAGDFAFLAAHGSGTVVAGGGDDAVVIAPSDRGDWSIALGNGDDIVLALGTGHDTIAASGGHNTIELHNPLGFLGVSGPLAAAANATLGGSHDSGSNVLLFTHQPHSVAGGTNLVEDFRHGADHIALAGFRPGEALHAVQTQTHQGGSTTLHLAGGTTVTFSDVRAIGLTDFQKAH